MRIIARQRTGAHGLPAARGLSSETAANASQTAWRVVCTSSCLRIVRRRTDMLAKQLMSCALMPLCVFAACDDNDFDNDSDDDFDENVDELPPEARCFTRQDLVGSLD